MSQVDLPLLIVVGAGSNGPASANTQTGQTLRILPGSPMPGQTVTFEASGFAPEVDGDLRVVNPSRQIDRVLLPVRTDSHGAFHLESAWPDYTTLPPDIYQLHLVLAAPVGAERPSDALLNGVKLAGGVLVLAATLAGVMVMRGRRR